MTSESTGNSYHLQNTNQRQKNRSKKGRLAVVRLLHALGLCFGGDRNYQSMTSESTRFFFRGPSQNSRADVSQSIQCLQSILAAKSISYKASTAQWRQSEQSKNDQMFC